MVSNISQDRDCTTSLDNVSLKSLKSQQYFFLPLPNIQLGEHLQISGLWQYLPEGIRRAGWCYCETALHNHWEVMKIRGHLRRLEKFLCPSHLQKGLIGGSRKLWAHQAYFIPRTPIPTAQSVVDHFVAKGSWLTGVQLFVLQDPKQSFSPPSQPDSLHIGASFPSTGLCISPC